MASVSGDDPTVTEYRYDALNRLIERHSPSDPSLDVQYRYDLTADGNKGIGRLGAVTEYRYDALNRLVERHSPSDPSLDVQYRYDLTADGNKGIGRLGAQQLPANLARWSLEPRRAVLLVHDMQRYFLRPLPESLRAGLVANAGRARGGVRHPRR